MRFAQAHFSFSKGQVAVPFKPINPLGVKADKLFLLIYGDNAIAIGIEAEVFKGKQREQIIISPFDFYCEQFTCVIKNERNTCVNKDVWVGCHMNW